MGFHFIVSKMYVLALKKIQEEQCFLYKSKKMEGAEGILRQGGCYKGLGAK